MVIFLQIFGGLVLLVAGGEVLVKGAVGLAQKLGISSIVIGLTVVAFGTSAPEMVVSSMATWSGHADIAIGNVVGSNIANILLVVGATALLTAVPTHRRLAVRDGSIMMATVVVLVFCGINSTIGFVESCVLILMIVFYTAYTVRDTKEEPQSAELVENFEEENAVALSGYLSLAMCVAGIGLLSGGSDLMVDGAVKLARIYGWSEGVIGVTIIAVGTSLPELITSVVAAYRRHADIGLANVVGSNIFNSTAVIGVSGMFGTITVSDEFLRRDLWVMLVVTAMFFVAMLTRKQIGRIEGLVMLVAYVAYAGWQYNIIT